MNRPREIALLAIGVTTPVGVLVVNGSAFVMRNLVTFRTGIAVCALMSGLLLNGLAAWWVVNQADKNTPDLYAEYRRWVLAIVILWVGGSSVVGAYFTFQGMSNPAQLPSSTGVITSVLALAGPFALAWLGKKITSRRSRQKSRGTAQA